MPNPSFTDIIRAYLEAQFGGDVPPIPGVTIDDELSTTSENPVMNRVITAALALKAAITDIPTKLSQLLNDSGYQTAAQVQTAISAAVPTKTSDLTNDSGYQTAAQVQSAIAAEVPTKTSDLTNDSGFQTAAQVQAAIAPLQSKAITDTGGYYTTDTVDGALQEIGAELAGVNTLLGSGVIT